jgi:uncharacterized protein YegP (UPF0339 family)
LKFINGHNTKFGLHRKGGTVRFEKYKDTSGEWRWRLKAANNRIVADSSESYKTEANVDRAIAMVRYFCDDVAIAEIVTVTKRGKDATVDKIDVGEVLIKLAKTADRSREKPIDVGKNLPKAKNVRKKGTRK